MLSSVGLALLVTVAQLMSFFSKIYSPMQSFSIKFYIYNIRRILLFRMMMRIIYHYIARLVYN